MGNQAREATGHWCSQCWGTNCELHSHSPEQFFHTSGCKVEGKGEKAKKKRDANMPSAVLEDPSKDYRYFWPEG